MSVWAFQTFRTREITVLSQFQHCIGIFLLVATMALKVDKATDRKIAEQEKVTVSIASVSAHFLLQRRLSSSRRQRHQCLNRLCVGALLLTDIYGSSSKVNPHFLHRKKKCADTEALESSALLLWSQLSTAGSRD
jgi:hypothetical protein